MVLIDTSVWIALYRKKKTEIGKKLWALVVENQAALCGQVWVEFIGGFREEPMRRIYEKSFRAFPFLETNRKTFELAANLLAEHPRLGSGDAIIAATAIACRAPLLTLDKDFRALASRGLELY